MRGFNHQLVVTTTEDEATGNVVPLFAFPVQVCTAVDKAEPKFDRAGPEGGALSRVWREAGTGEIVEEADVLQGVRNGDQFTPVDADAIKAIDDAIKSPDIVVERMVPLADVPLSRVCGKRFLQVPAKGGNATYYHGLYKSLLPAKKKGKRAARAARALRVSYVSRTRQKLGVVYADPDEGCLILVDLEFAASLRQPDEQVLAHQHAEVPEDVVEKISAVIDGLDSEEAGDFDAPVDATIAKRAELVEQALMGEAIEAPGEAPAPVTTDDLSAILEKSLAGVS